MTRLDAAPEIIALAAELGIGAAAPVDGILVALHREPAARCLADGCGHKEPLLPLMAFGLSLMQFTVLPDRRERN